MKKKEEGKRKKKDDIGLFYEGSMSERYFKEVIKKICSVVIKGTT